MRYICTCMTIRLSCLKMGLDYKQGYSGEKYIFFYTESACVILHGPIIL